MNYTDTAKKLLPITWEKRFLLLISLIFLLKMLVIWIYPLGVNSEEAYYLNWGRHLDWGYFSKPPMIAWINALTIKLLGATSFTIRIPSVILAIVTFTALFASAQRMFNSKIAFYAVAVLVFSPAGCVIGFPMTTDAPMLCFWGLSMYSFWRAIEDKKIKPIWALTAAIAIGLGCLSKQMVLAALFLFILFLLLSSEDRDKLKSPWIFIMVIVSLAFLIPPVYWNWQNDWPTFTHTAHQISRKGDHWWSFIINFPELVGSQVGLLTPVSFFLFTSISIAMIKNFNVQDRRVKFLLLLSSLPIACFFIMSFVKTIYANWPAGFYFAGVILLAAWGCGAVKTASIDKWRKAFKPGIYIGGVLTGVVCICILTVLFTNIWVSKDNPKYKQLVWNNIAKQIDEQLEGTPNPDKTFLLADNRHYLSLLSFHMKGQPHIYKWTHETGIHSQYDIWKGPVDKIGWDCIFITKYKNTYEDIDSIFESVRFLKKVSYKIGDKEFAVHLFLFRKLKHWPDRK